MCLDNLTSYAGWNIKVPSSVAQTGHVARKRPDKDQPLLPDLPRKLFQSYDVVVRSLTFHIFDISSESSGPISTKHGMHIPKSQTNVNENKLIIPPLRVTEGDLAIGSVRLSVRPLPFLVERQ